jgi:hypothetical protein
MSQAQDAMLGNLPNGIVATLANRYVTNIMNADPETKLIHGQQCTTETTAFATCNMLNYDTFAIGHIDKERVSWLYAIVAATSRKTHSQDLNA